MIAETPAPTCTTSATPLRRKQMARARAASRLRSKASLTGVLFFDFNHGQTGVAPNAIELHPLLSFRCMTPPAFSQAGPAIGGPTGSFSRLG